MSGPCWGCGTALEIKDGKLYEVATGFLHGYERCEQIIENAYELPESVAE